MFGLEPSLAAIKSLKSFQKNNIKNIVELGAGLGRDTIFFAQNSIYVEALDYSNASIESIINKSKKLNIADFIKPKVFDVRKKLPFKDNSIEGVYSHMLYCMALTSFDLQSLNTEIHRILKPGGVNIYTARHTNDGDYKKGLYIGEDMYENDGFIVHFFSKNKVNSLLNGFANLEITNFEEGNFPRKLFFVVNKKL